jgi:sigma-B regulation protein RsbU (phosphoserine phosphatase)
LGAEDYISKPFNPVFLRARIGASLEKKRLRDQEQKTFQALLESQRKIAANLHEAAQYVESLLPRKLENPVRTDYLFQPSSDLGGDIFGYHFLDEAHFAMYLLDVSGHGVGAALLSVSVMNVIRARTLGNVDFRQPAAVLAALNQTFQMENQNNLFFTIWYGVYSRTEKSLAYASGGHPPALLRHEQRWIPLSTRGPAVGCLPEYLVSEGKTPVSPGDQLLIFSDGVYELVKADGTPATYAEFETIVRERNELELTPNALLKGARKLQGRDNFDDDFSLLSVTF